MTNQSPSTGNPSFKSLTLSDQDVDRIAFWEPQRAACRPAECLRGYAKFRHECWVTDGASAYSMATTQGFCTGCGGKPRNISYPRGRHA